MTKPKPAAYELTGQEVGAPTKYRPHYCEAIIRMAKEGMGPAEWAAEFDISRTTIYSWRAEFPDFLNAWTRAEIQLQAWWERAGRVGMVSDKFNSTVWAKNMACRFKDEWREATDNRHTHEAGDSFTNLLGKFALAPVFPKADGDTDA